MKTIREAWELYNRTLWAIQRFEMRDMYWYMDTNRYIYQAWDGIWHGKKKYIDNEDNKIFRNEEHAVRWLLGIKK
jgi:hypothetical protein